ncbi:hypothetical protein CK203_086242 [Vitis vinifera]|uniref:Retrovirus-related Pol polyprotein from transposon RE1 n=1 Tax=Vitis vinifera TaxID=29760 RepID=A0A438EDD5_VITVI|nr:hypothetical protein CK203_086242 [Vitis vinifera]
MQLRLELQSTKKGSMSMIDYIMKIKGAVDNLATIGEPVSEQDQVMNLLRAFEHRLEQQSSIEQMSANYASSSNNRGGGRKFNGGRGQGYAPNNNNYTYRGCGCGGRNGQGGQTTTSHSLNNWNQKNIPDMVASASNSPVDESWYLDSGASHHLTQNLRNLTSTSPYTGIDRVTIGNGSTIRRWFLLKASLKMGFTSFPVFNNKKPCSSINNASAFHSHFSSTDENKAELWHNRLAEGSTLAIIAPTSFPTPFLLPYSKISHASIDSHSLSTSESPVPTASSSPLDTSSSSPATDLPPKSVPKP